MTNKKLYKDFILPTTIDNFDAGDLDYRYLGLPKSKDPAPHLKTTDYIFVDEAETKRIKCKHLSDFAFANGVEKESNNGCARLTRSTLKKYHKLIHDRDFEAYSINQAREGAAPYTKLSLDACNHFKIKVEKAYPFRHWDWPSDYGREPFDQAIIEFAEYPFSYKNEFQGKTPEELGAIKTDNSYTGRYDNKTKTYQKWQEYSIDGQLYVYGQIKNSQSFGFDETYYGYDYYSGPKIGKTGTYSWYKVEPIRWVIKNWDKLPTSINPKGNGKDDFLMIESEFVIVGGIPFLTMEDFDETKNLWQNCTLRGMLNSINMNIEREGDNPDFELLGGGNFEGMGFLHEVFEKEITKTIDLSKDNSENENSKNNNDEEIDIEI